MRRFKYAYSALVYYGEDIGASIDRVARFGYDGIELLGQPETYDAPAVRRRVADAGISVSSISSVISADRDFAHPDPEIRANALAYLNSLTDLAVDVGAPVIVGRPSASMKLLPLADAEDEWRWAVDGLRAAGEYAAECGVSVALECWTRFETYFLNRLEQAVELWEAIGLTNGGVMGDTFHMNIEEASLGDAIRRAGPHLAHMHLADSNRLPPGYGHTDFRDVLQALDEVDYTGWLAFELLPDTADPFTVFRAGGHADFFDRYTHDAITHMRQLEDELGAGN